MTDWVPAQISLDVHGRRILDTAGGILMGLRRCSSEAAFHELHGAAQRHRIPVCTMAWALVHLAGGRRHSPDSLRGAQSAASHEWGRLFAESGV
ncbi:MAG TPA: ANTAR domain-containing protein [Mycobacterium sp.]|uniref:ANTAR domain-containing protein n=1 Tax=Mycobacterium sp. TaxID=1785 RepID=UPI002D4B6E75|nr:ANTAR domain-containing protein [Mycobacterium sp.]HZU48685.1 ANTAR domain-containing protein [Mycobacterium sp.]